MKFRGHQWLPAAPQLGQYDRAKPEARLVVLLAFVVDEVLHGSELLTTLETRGIHLLVALPCDDLLKGRAHTTPEHVVLIPVRDDE